MSDKLYPHTSWFVQSESESMKKEYCYEMKLDQFVTWTVMETRRGSKDPQVYSNLIFIQKRFENILTITKKRSLFFAFKSYVIRDRKGVIAGIYSQLRNNSITLFYPKDDQKFQIKFPVSGTCQPLSCPLTFNPPLHSISYLYGVNQVMVARFCDYDIPRSLLLRN